MRSYFKKIGLTLSAAAILVTAIFLPCHHHEEKVTDCAPSHCSVCHFSKEGKAGADASSVSGAPVAVLEIPVIAPQTDPAFPLLAGSVSQRAPPSS